MKRHLRYISFSFLLILFLSACSQAECNKTKTQDTLDHPATDILRYAILQFDTIDSWLFKNVTPTSLCPSEIQEIELILRKFINNYNLEQKHFFDSISKIHPEYNLQARDFVLDPSRYKRQYFPFLNSGGQKEVWVNCFCNDFDKNWRKKMLLVQDGGNCYFNLIINLTTNTFYRVMVNGEA